MRRSALRGCFAFARPSQELQGTQLLIALGRGAGVGQLLRERLCSRELPGGGKGATSNASTRCLHWAGGDPARGAFPALRPPKQRRGLTGPSSEAFSSPFLGRIVVRAQVEMLVVRDGGKGLESQVRMKGNALRVNSESRGSGSADLRLC